MPYSNVNRLIAMFPQTQPSVPRQFAQGAAQMTELGAASDKIRQQKRDRAMTALAVGGAGYAQEMGYQIDPNLAQAIEENPQYMDALQKQYLQKKGTDSKFLEEIRSESYKARNRFNTRSEAVRGGYEKMKAVYDAAKSGDRTAMATMTMSLARLVSPGVVTDKDVQQISGAANPWAATLNFIAGKTDKAPELRDLAKYYDPVGNIDADSMFAVGTNIALAEAPGLLSSYQSAKSMATRSNMPENQYYTIFGDNDNESYLNQLLQNPTIQIEPKEPPKPQPTKEQKARQKADKARPVNERDKLKRADDIVNQWKQRKGQ